MERVLFVVNRLFNRIFITNISGWGIPLINAIINRIISLPFLIIGTVLLIIGFAVGIIKRLIHS